MTRSRDMADAGKVINYLDDVSSAIQTQLGAGQSRYATGTKAANVTLDADTHYLSGPLIINNGITMTIPADTLIEFKQYATGKAL